MVAKNRVCQSKTILASVDTVDKCAAMVENNKKDCADGGGYFGFMENSCLCCTLVDEALSDSIDSDNMNLYMIRGKTYADTNNGKEVTWKAFKNYCADNENNGVETDIAREKKSH